MPLAPVRVFAPAYARAAEHDDVDAGADAGADGRRVYRLCPLTPIASSRRVYCPALFHRDAGDVAYIDRTHADFAIALRKSPKIEQTCIRPIIDIDLPIGTLRQG